MSKFIIEGGHPLRGSVKISGSKNATLPIIASTLLTDETCKLSNVPRIDDVKNLLKIMEKLGSKYEFVGNDLTIRTEKFSSHILDEKLVHRLRASILLMGPMLARIGKCKMPHPGGCIIGKRPIGVHFDALREIGATIKQDDEYYIAEAKQIKLKGSIYLDEASVTATENAMMAAALGNGEITICPAACEPHIQDLADFLTKMGARISGAGTHSITISGVDKLSGAEHRVVSDEIEAGTFAIAAIATKGRIKLENAPIKNMAPIIHKLTQMGAEYRDNGETIEFVYKGQLKAAKIQVDTWPGLPSDLQSPLSILATQAEGTSLIHDWMFERRLMYTDELAKMGANITLCDPHRALITGPTVLKSTNIISPDLRAGITLVIAALTAKGESEIDHIELIDRGYEQIDKRLAQIGAKIRRIES